MTERQERLILFAVAHCLYGVPVLAVREIVPLPQLTGDGEPGIEGRFVLDGTSVAVVSAAHRLGLDEPPRHPYTPILVSRSGDRGLLVDRVLDIRSVDRAAWVQRDGELVVAEFGSESGQVRVLDADRLWCGELVG